VTVSSTVAVGGMEISSNHESAEEMVTALKPPKEDDGKTPRVVEDAGKVLEPEAEPDPLSKAAAELGKKGGEAAAKARAERDKEADKTPDKAEAKSKEDKAEGEDKGEDKLGHRRHDPRAAVMEARRAQREAEDRARALEERLARLEARVAPDDPKGGDAPKKAVTGQDGSAKGNGKPSPDQFDTYEDYIEAFTDWKADRILERQAERARMESESEAFARRQQEKVDAFNARVKKAQEADPEVIDRIDPRLLQLQPTFTLPPGSAVTAANDIAQAIIESEHSAALLLYLSEHEEVMGELLRLPDSYAVTRAVGRLEAKLESVPPPAPRGVSKAPPPVRPVASTPNPGELDVMGEMDFDTFYRRRAARRA
jgi:hypothetical protein